MQKNLLVAPVLGAAVVTVLTALPARLSFADTRVVAATGDPAPGGTGTVIGFGYVSLNNLGQAAFTGAIVGGPAGADGALFRGDGVRLDAIALTGQAAPGGGTFSHVGEFFNAPALSETGQVAFTATTVDGGGTENRGLFTGAGGPVTAVARQGQAAPGGSTFSFVGTPSINAVGGMAFFGDTAGVPLGGVFRANSSGGGLTSIVRRGGAIPVGPGTFQNIAGPFLVNNAGQVVFRGELTGTGSSLNDEGIYRGSGGGLTQIAREGQAAPGGGVFDSFALGLPNPQPINNSGNVAFLARLRNTPGGGAADEGVFRGSGSAITRIVRDGQVAPDGIHTFSSYGAVALNDSGQVAFMASLAGPVGGNYGVFRGDGLSVTQVALQGQAAPGGGGTFINFSDPALNASGQVAFVAGLTDTPTGTAGGSGIFLFDDARGLLPVAKLGDSFLGSTIIGLGFSNDSFGRDRGGLNDRGQVAYSYSLAKGGGGVAVFTVPEPSSTLAVVGVAMLTLARPPRRRHCRAPR